MTEIEQKVAAAIASALDSLYGIKAADVQLAPTRKDFEGDVTLVVFPYLKQAKKKPQEVAEEIGAWLTANASDVVEKTQTVQGFLNICLHQSGWADELKKFTLPQFELTPEKDGVVCLEYSSPNTNKPLHLGHVRNNLLGASLARIMERVGKRVIKTNIVNDRGIHICKSMLAWQKWGEGKTPEMLGIKGDHLVGDFYVRFDKEYRKEIAALMAQGQTEDEAKKNAPLIKEAQQMLEKWEKGDAEVRTLWEKMNSWVYAGFDETYKRLGVSFDKIYYESQTYLDGKKKVNEGLDKGLFYRKEDGSVWADLTNEGLDEKLLLRADGTSVYMTQDIGTAQQRYQDYNISRMIYVVGNEQNYHFQVLSLLLDRLGFEWGKSIVHYSYGMVELPNGKMKSREGTVVDADDLMDKMEEDALQMAETQGKAKEQTDAEKKATAKAVGHGALKYYILKVDPRKNMLFNPAESIDFNGNTGPFVQYTHARICSLLQKANINAADTQLPQFDADRVELTDLETQLVQNILSYRQTLVQAADQLSPAIICNYVYALCQQYNHFYHDLKIVTCEDENQRAFRLALSACVRGVIADSLSLLGIEAPMKM